MAEREGFEPPVELPTAVFKTAALNHSATSPLLTYLDSMLHSLEHEGHDFIRKV